MATEHAAGGVVFRLTPGGKEVLMISDRFGRLTLPKGKLEAGESSEQAGLREIQEETGIEGRILAKLVTIYYSYNDPRRGQIDKQVDYYLVEALTEYITPQLEEITTAAWMGVDRAIELCGYENNLQVLDKAKEMLENSPAK